MYKVVLLLKDHLCQSCQANQNLTGNVLKAILRIKKVKKQLYVQKRLTVCTVLFQMKSCGGFMHFFTITNHENMIIKLAELKRRGHGTEY